MNEKLATIDFKGKGSTIDFINMQHYNYSQIMRALETVTILLKTEIDDPYYDSNRKDLQKKYQDLYDLLKTQLEWKGQAISIEDTVFEKILNSNHECPVINQTISIGYNYLAL